MLRASLMVVLLSGLLFCASDLYTVKLGVYQNKQSLSEMIEKYSPALKKTVTTYQKEDVTVATTLPTANKKLLIKLLPAYKKVFKDAYITPMQPISAKKN